MGSLVRSGWDEIMSTISGEGLLLGCILVAFVGFDLRYVSMVLPGVASDEDGGELCW